jgi:uncharacterized RDD family membrane protein YckC
MAAGFYDGLLLLALWLSSLLASAFMTTLSGLPRNDRTNSVLLLVVGAVYFCWSWTHGGQTLGMRAWRLKLRRLDGAPVRWQVALVRYVLMLASWLIAAAVLVLPLLPEAVATAVPGWQAVAGACAAYTVLALLFLLRDGGTRALYDWLSGTVVMRSEE